LKGYRVIRSQSKPGLRAVVEPKQDPSCCARCGGSKLHSKGRYRRRVKHLRSFGSPVELVVECRRFQCLECRRSFVQPLPGIRSGRHSSEPLREHIYLRHEEGTCVSRLAQLVEMGSATIERIYHQFTARRARERRDWQCPVVLGIDEHTLHKGCRFATTLCDLRNHSVFDVVEGKGPKELEPFLASLQGRERVRVICIDMSSTYRSLIRRYFPNARIVADRFHVIRIVHHHFLALMRSIAPELKNHRGWLAALRKRPERLTERQRQRRDELFAGYPAFVPIYEQMQALCNLLRAKHRKKSECRPLAEQLLYTIEQLRKSGFAPLATLAHTLSSWSEEIACMWRFTKNNGITEGFHRKMKLIQRRAYGFRNFNNYRLRVLAQCS
jgi:transposase